MELTVERIEQALAGERAAKEALSAWCLQHAFRLAYVDLGSAPNRQTLAGEIAGEASLQAMTHLDQFHPENRFDGWLHQIVRNCIRYHFRQQDRTLPQPVYQRWVHDFLHTYGPELEALIQREYGQEPSDPHPVLFQRIATDLREKTYRQFKQLSYEGRANAVLETVRQWLRSFVGLDFVSLYQQDEGGEWIEIDLPAEDEVQAQVLQQEFIQQVNERLAELQPQCRRLLRWHYLDDLRVPDIARLEQISERTAYRRLESCSDAFRARLMRDGYFAEYAAREEGALTAGRRG